MIDERSNITPFTPPATALHWPGEALDAGTPTSLQTIKLGDQGLLASRQRINQAGILQLAEYLKTDATAVSKKLQEDKTFVTHYGPSDRTDGAHCYRIIGQGPSQNSADTTPTPDRIPPFFQLIFPYHTAPEVGAMFPSGQTHDLMELLGLLDHFDLLSPLVSPQQSAVVTVGPGAGIEPLFLGNLHTKLAQKLAQTPGGQIVAPEINPAAAKLAGQNFELNQTNLLAKISCFVSTGFADLDAIMGKIALCTFNPPSVLIPLELYQTDPTLSPYLGGQQADVQCAHIRDLARGLGPKGMGIVATSSRTDFAILERTASASGLQMIILTERLFEYNADKFERIWTQARTALARYNQARRDDQKLVMANSYAEAMTHEREDRNQALHALKVMDSVGNITVKRFERYRIIAFVRATESL